MIESRDLGQYFGFTEEEVEEQCRKYDVNYAEMKNGTTDIS